MNKIVSILRRRQVVQELISRGPLMEAHSDDVCLGTNSPEDRLILLQEFFDVCQQSHTRLKLAKFELMQETMQYLGCDPRECDIGYGWWTLRRLSLKGWWMHEYNMKNLRKDFMMYAVS